MILAALLLLSASHQNWGGAYGWRCSASFSADGYEGGMWRDFGPGAENEPYKIQARLAGASVNRVSWTISSRPGEAPRDPRRELLTGRPEADAFRNGPDYVHIDFGWRTSAVGPIWAHYWGDGVYAGADMLMSRWDVRRYTDRDGTLGGLSGGLASRPLLAALAPARQWTVVVMDAAGKQLVTESFPIPSWQAVEAEYRRARTRIDSLEARFRLDHEPRGEDGASCADNENPEGYI